MNRIFALFGSALSLVGLYLLLRNAGGATAIIRGIGSGSVDIFRTLQGR